MSFLIVVSLLAVLAVLLLAWPLLRSLRPASEASPTTDSERDKRLAVYRDRKLEIEAERAAGRLSAAEAERSQNELIDEVSREFGPAALEPAANSGGARPRPWLAIGLSAFVAVIAMLIYQQVGVPALGLDPKLSHSGGRDSGTERMLAQLEERAQGNPSDSAAWVSLAEGRMGAGDFQRAALAYQQATRLITNDARLLADYAEALALSRNGDLSGEPTELLKKAQGINAKDPKMLSLLASAEYQQGNFKEARRYLVTLLDVTTAGSEQAKRVQQAIAQVDNDIAGGGAPARPQAPRQAAAAPAPAAAAPAPAAVKGSAVAGTKTVSGTIEIAPALRSKVPPNALLVVFARAAEGSRMPYAVLPLGGASFPAKFELSDAQSMTQDRLLSSASKVVVEARVSLGGGMMPKTGDLFGVSASSTVGSNGVRVVIDKVVP